MKLTPLALAMSLVGAPLLQAGELKAPQNPDNVIPGQFIVVFKQDVMNQSALTLSASGGMKAAVYNTVKSLSESLNIQASQSFSSVIQGAVFEMDEKTAKKLAAHPSVDFIEYDQTIQVSGVQNNPTWGIDRLDQRGSNLDGKYTYDTTASNVNVYVIDTGVNNHSDFGGRVYNGWDFIDNDSNSSDCQGHGTHVAGTIASATWGAAKGAKVYGVRVLDCQGSGSNSGVISGLDWVAQNHSKPAVANMSLGGGASSAVDDAVTNLVNAGVVTVVAAGNDNSNACNYSPARAAKAITVGSIAQGDTRSSFSNYGSCVDIFGPSSNITSTSQSGGSTTMSGTSMASPHVAGVAALYLAGNPNATPAQIEGMLKDNATTNAVGDAKGSPNLLVYSRLVTPDPDPDPTPDPDPDPTPGDKLSNGVPVTGLSASTGNEIVYTMDVPSGASNIKFEMSGGTGDADMYVKFGSKPTDSSYDCRPYKNGNAETCTGSQSGGTYYVRLKAYSSFSGVSLKGSYTGDTNPPTTDPIDVSAPNISVSSGQWARYYYDLPEGYSSMTVSISGGTGDADLYVNFGQQSSLSDYDCRPYKNGNNETCTFNNPQSGRWYLDIYGYSTASGVTLRLQAN